jgi:hypothetical protein
MENINNVLRFKTGNYKYIHSYLAYAYCNEVLNHITDVEKQEYIKTQVLTYQIFKIVKNIKELI